MGVCVSRGVSLKEPAQIALNNLRHHKLRSFLTLLGTILSVFSLILVISLINGVDLYIADKVANLGSNVFLVTRMGIVTNAAEAIRLARKNKRVTWEEYEWLRDNMRLAKAVGVEVRNRGKIRFGNETLEPVSINGVTANIGDMDVAEPNVGRYITDTDNDHRTMVTFVGSEVAEKLFKGSDPMGKMIYLDSRPFTVVGVAKPLGTVLGQSQDSFAYIPVQTFLKIYGTQRSLSINVQSRSAEVMAQTQEEAKLLMRAIRGLKGKDDDTFAIFSSDTLLNLWSTISSGIAYAMIGVVSVFLVIGGVVIMNVMLANVTERTREIGIRKSLGATRRDILMQFLVESGVMAAMGGALGLLVAWGIALVVNAATPLPMRLPLYAIALAIGISGSVGLFFGIYPASKAAKLNPIEALRYEM